MIVVLSVPERLRSNLLKCSSILQVSTQTGEDSTGRDTQTDDVVMVNRWVQWPPVDLRGWGCDDDDNNDDEIIMGGVNNILLSEKEVLGLSKFLQNASQVRPSHLCNEITLYSVIR